MADELINGKPGSAQVIQKYGVGMTKVLDCPRAMVGHVIGKGGETIKALQRDTGAAVQLDQNVEPCKVTLSGPPQKVQAAADMVQEIINGVTPLSHRTQFEQFGGPLCSQMGAPQPGTTPSQFPPCQYQQPPPWPNGGYNSNPPPAPYPDYYNGQGYAPSSDSPAPAPVCGVYTRYGQADPCSNQAHKNQPYVQPNTAAVVPQQAQPAPVATPAMAESGWQELQDTENRPYYFNTRTGVSQWEKPAVPATAVSVWKEFQDAENRPYYYNTQSGVSQWEKPAELQ